MNPVRQSKPRRKLASEERRERVCLACALPHEFTFGGVHSEAACMRCGKSPMGHGKIVGPSAWAERASAR